jgi:glycosyltransferase involved in cell wall biosynthesis
MVDLMNQNTLPRLLYLSDLPVEATLHGSALVYRLFQTFPSDRLRIVEGYRTACAEKRLPGVAYGSVRIGADRLLYTRCQRAYSRWLSLVANGRARRVPAVLGEFEPEAVVTVTVGYLWRTAAEFARRRNLPLHLILHDDWGVDHRLLRSVYRQARSRLCVSPYMAAEYERRFGAKAEVLYPSRAVDTETFDAPPAHLAETGRGLTFAYAGSINTPGYSRLLRILAEQLAPHGGRLLIFGPLQAERAAAAGLVGPNIQLAGMLKSTELVHRLRAEADVLFVPMSFADKDRDNMALSFPSKLTDCTAVGIPLLICGPEYCSAVRWARENPSVAEIVTRDDAAALSLAVERLVNDPARRVALGENALRLGKRYFSHAAAWEVFRTALADGRMLSRPTAPITRQTPLAQEAELP